MFDSPCARFWPSSHCVMRGFGDLERNGWRKKDEGYLQYSAKTTYQLSINREMFHYFNIWRLCYDAACNRQLWSTKPKRFITPKKDVFISRIILNFLLHDYFPSWALVPVSPPHDYFFSRDNLAVNTSFRRTSLLPDPISSSIASHTLSYSASTFFMKFLALCCFYFNFKSHFLH